MFLHKGSITLTLRNVPANIELEIDFSKSAIVHPDVRELIEDFKETAKGKNIMLRIIERNESVRVKADNALQSLSIDPPVILFNSLKMEMRTHTKETKY